MLTPEQTLALLRQQIENTPPMDITSMPDETLMRWFAKTGALIEQVDLGIAIRFRLAQQSKGLSTFSRRDVMQAAHDAYYKAELLVPVEHSGSFIPAGDAWNGYAALLQICQGECDRLLIVDPYVVSDIFIDLIPHAVSKNGVHILTSKHRDRHAPLYATLQKWNSTHSASNSVEVRYAAEGTLHDRLIIVNDKQVWLVSQSIKDIGRKSAASVTKAESQLAGWKVDHYKRLWLSSTPIA